MEIKFGIWRVNKNPSVPVQIITGIHKDSGKEFVKDVKIPMLLVETGKQVIRMTKDAISSFNAKVFAEQQGLNYISHRVI